MELLTYNSETIEFTYYLKDGVRIRHGLSRKWFELGKLKFEFYFKDGNYHGLCKEWYDNGQLAREKNYKDGEYHGLCRDWYDNGQLYREFNYWDGIKYESEEEYQEVLITNKSW